MSTPICPAAGCGLPAAQASVRDIDEHTHELTGCCERGHLWTTKWFAAEKESA